MRHAARMVSDSVTSIPVIDFRRRSMALKWHSLGGTWTACDTPPPLVHGVALIRASQPNICVYGQAGRLRLQVGLNQLKGIAGLNVLRVMRKAEAVAARLQKERQPSDVRIEEVDKK